MKNVQCASLYRYNKMRMAFNLLLKLINLQLKLHYPCVFDVYNIMQ